jgi:hypothetical protein
MKLNKATIDLICELERIIGAECYNPNSFDGWTLEEGRSFRYPVSYENKDGLARKTRLRVENMDKDHINSIRYVFGSNNLFIGSAIVRVLERLEQKYGLDFDELVKGNK